MNASTTFLDDNLVYIYKEFTSNYLPEFIKIFEYKPWVFSLLGSAVIGLSGILPLAIIPANVGDHTKNSEGYTDPAESKSLKVLLSFAVGGLLGDVFLHLLPEAWSSDAELGAKSGHPSMRSGLWVLTGVLLFTIVEKIFSGYANADEDNPQPKCVEIANCLLRKKGGKFIPGEDDSTICAGTCDIEDISNGTCYLRELEKKNKDNSNNNQNHTDNLEQHQHLQQQQHHHHHQPNKIAGYLNLMANSIDNFTHGLAVAGSFLVSFRHGILATFAILLHEIPHEVGDFAILLRSGFSRWDAARAQLLTAGAGLLGALVAIGGTGVTTAMEARTSWIMPFTAGGFLHIALVTVLPDLLKEEDPKESFKQLLSLICGISIMAVMTILFES